MKKSYRLLSILLVFVFTYTIVSADARVVYEMDLISDQKANIELKWSEQEDDDIRIQGFEVISDDSVVIFYETGIVGASNTTISLLLDDRRFPINIILKSWEGDEPFSDVTVDSESKDAILNLYYQGYINGYPDGTFRPTSSLSREEFAAMLVKVAGIEIDEELTSIFSDVDDDRWSAPYIMALAEKDIVSGKDGNLFEPEATITIGEVAAMIDRTFIFYETQDKPAMDEDNDHWANGNMQTLYEADLIQLNDAFYNEPDRKTTREDCAILLNRTGFSLKDVK